jgi:hypothetical protein
MEQEEGAMNRGLSHVLPLIMLCPLAGAPTGPIVTSAAPPEVSQIKVGTGSVEATGATLGQIVRAITKTDRVRVQGDIANTRYDVSVAAEARQELMQAFTDVARAAGIRVEIRTESGPVWVLKPGNPQFRRSVSYRGRGPHSRLSCNACGAETLRASLEQHLKAPVAIEAEVTGSRSIDIAWVDEASLIAALEDVLGVHVIREQRAMPVWVVSAAGRE